MYPVMGSCPVCGEALRVARLRCHNCETTIEGDFGLPRFARLEPEQTRFVEIFLKNRGSLKDVGQELGISYPTVVKHLNDILVTLGFGDSVRPPEEPITPDQRRDIIERVARGEISADGAARLLRARITSQR